GRSLESAASDSRRRDTQLRRDRTRPAHDGDGAGGRRGLRGEPHCGCRALPSRREVRRLDLRLSLGCAAQAPPDQYGGRGVMGANPRKTKAKGADNAPGSGPAASTAAIEARVDAVDWTMVQAELDVQGWAVAPKLLTHAEADSIAGLYSQERGFRSHVIMARHGFGRGEYKYFSYPLPPLIQALRRAAYPHLVPIANQWQERMGKELRFPGDHAAFLDRCHQAGQTRPTPLLLEYAPEDYNCLHRDLYGEHVFPLQIAILLDQPGEDFEGGEFVMTEQRPRMQSRPMV